MPIITGRENVLAVYEEAAKKGWVIPCLCSENLTTTEAILSAASEFATEKGYDSIPITLAMTIAASLCSIPIPVVGISV